MPERVRDWTYVAQAALGRLQDVEPSTTLVRLFHGRGKTHPGFEDVTVDLLGSVIVVALFAEDDESVSELGELLRLGLLRSPLADSTVVQEISGGMMQLRRGRQTQSQVLWGDVPERAEGQENNLRYILRPRRNQNVGLFLDAQPLRHWVTQNASGRKVLNLFAYTCGFSLAAIAGGAAQVVNNDMSRPALDWGKENHALNNHPVRQIAYVPHNLLKSWWKVRQFGPYDLVIIDPPTNQRGSFNAEKQYGGVIKQVSNMLAPGALVVICLNSPFLGHNFIENQAARWLPKARFLRWLPSSSDYPEAEPERALKVGLFQQDGLFRQDS